MKWYKYDIRSLSDYDYSKWYSQMSDHKRQRVDLFRSMSDKKRAVAGEMLARKAIAEWCSISPESIIFAIGEHGKPYAVGLDVEFNISHSGNMVVCAVDNNPVGIDIQWIRPVNLAAAKRICTEQELIYLFGHYPTKTDFVRTADTAVLNRFFELWTKKEACGKCLGFGLRHPLTTADNSFEILHMLLAEQYHLTVATLVKTPPE